MSARIHRFPSAAFADAFMSPDLLPGCLHGSVSCRFPVRDSSECGHSETVVTNTLLLVHVQYVHIAQSADTILHLLHKRQVKLASICSQFTLHCLQNPAEVYLFKKLFMQFQLILWEFNCKSNKNIKSYHMRYENIVSNLLTFLKKYPVISPNQETAQPPPSRTLQGKPARPRPGVQSGRAAGGRSDGLRVCPQTLPATHETPGTGEICKNKSLFLGRVRAGGRFRAPVGLQGTWQGFLRGRSRLEGSTGCVTVRPAARSRDTAHGCTRALARDTDPAHSLRP